MTEKETISVANFAVRNYMFESVDECMDTLAKNFCTDENGCYTFDYDENIITSIYDNITPKVVDDFNTIIEFIMNACLDGTLMINDETKSYISNMMKFMEGLF